MKTYRKQLNKTEQPVTPEVNTTQSSAPEPKQFTQSQEARVNFMRKIVADARVRG